MLDPQEMISTNTLEALRFSVAQHLDPYALDMEVSQYEDFMFSLGQRVAWEFRAKVFADKLADETHTVSQQVHFDVETSDWVSAWQLWKWNRRSNRVFGWLHKRWPAKRTGARTFQVVRQANVKFDVKKYVTFPELKKSYPSTLGNHFRYVETRPGPLWWDK